MKKLLLLLSVTSVILAGCAGDSIKEENKDYIVVDNKKGFLSTRKIIKEKETGCYYLESTYNFTPYYDENGKVKGCGEHNEK